MKMLQEMDDMDLTKEEAWSIITNYAIPDSEKVHACYCWRRYFHDENTDEGCDE